jgi:hypothetical protein
MEWRLDFSVENDAEHCMNKDARMNVGIVSYNMQY